MFAGFVRVTFLIGVEEYPIVTAQFLITVAFRYAMMNVLTTKLGTLRP